MSRVDARPVRLGFVGAGWIAARAVAPAVHAANGARLQAVASRDAGRARALEPAGRVHSDYAALLQDPEVDAVYISLTNEVHLLWTLAALDAGKHVLCEKPLGLDPAEVRRMHAAAEAAGLVLLEGYFYRWHPRQRRIEELVADGALGAVTEIDVEFSFDGGGEVRMAGSYRLDPARGGGALYDVGVYPVSAAHALLGRELAVETARQRIGPTGVDVETSATLRAGRTGEGALARIGCGIDGRDDQHLRITSEGAQLATAAGETFTSWHTPSGLTITTLDGVVRKEEFAPVDAYRLMVEAFAARIRGEQVWMVTAADSIAVATTLEMIRSAVLIPR